MRARQFCRACIRIGKRMRTTVKGVLFIDSLIYTLQLLRYRKRLTITIGQIHYNSQLVIFPINVRTLQFH